MDLCFSFCGSQVSVLLSSVEIRRIQFVNANQINWLYYDTPLLILSFVFISFITPGTLYFCIISISGCCSSKNFIFTCLLALFLEVIHLWWVIIWILPKHAVRCWHNLSRSELGVVLLTDWFRTTLELESWLL